MNAKNKMIAFLEMAIVLCSVLLVTLPAIAAEQTAQKASTSASTTTASEDDYVLGVYGNANEDDTIDMRDLTYVKLIFFGKKPETELADAKYDGKINPLDFIQIKLIIVEKEKEITVVDSAGRTVTIYKPVKRIIALTTDAAELLRAIEAEDKIVGVGSYVVDDEIFFPELSKLTSLGSFSKPDKEKVVELEPDIVVVYTFTAKKLDIPGITILGFDCYKPESMEEELEKLGYILEKEEEAEAFFDYIEGYTDAISDRVAGLSDDERVQVYLENKFDYEPNVKDSGVDRMCTIAGGINIAGDLPAGVVDPEWVIEENPPIIIKQAPRGVASGYDEDDYTGMKETRDDIMNRPGWNTLTAVKNGRVYIQAADIIAQPSYVVGIAYMAKWFYPELFEDLDPKVIHQEYLTRFQHLDYDLDKHGVFVYPPLPS